MPNYCSIIIILLFIIILYVFCNICKKKKKKSDDTFKWLNILDYGLDYAAIMLRNIAK